MFIMSFEIITKWDNNHYKGVAGWGITKYNSFIIKWDNILLLQRGTIITVIISYVC